MTAEELRTLILQKIETGLNARILGRDVVRGEDRKLLVTAREWVQTMPDSELERFIQIQDEAQ